MNKESLSSYIDHTLLKPEATEKQIIKICEEAKEYNFASVCINPTYVQLASNNLIESDVKVCTVIGFPLGATDTETKAFEASKAISNGASEIDMVINIGYLKSRNCDYVKEDISKIANVVKGKGLLKVIIETCLLTTKEKITACKIVKEAGADFVKTSTGFSSGGALESDIRLIRETVGDGLKIKASGGIRDYETAIKMINAGADRIGCSSSLKIIGAI